VESLLPFGSESSVLLPARSANVKIYKTLILPVVLYGCETWSLTLREEYRLRVFENRVLRRIFGPKRDEVMGEQRNCIMGSFIICTHHQSKSRRMRWAGHVPCMEEGRNVYRIW
jgi:hypothetical protein